MIAAHDAILVAMPTRAPRHRPAHTHTKREREYRPSSAVRGYGHRWRQARASYLGRHPLCLECQAQGVTKAATDVDHEAAVSGPDDPRFWDESNWQGLCHACHAAKTVAEDAGFGRGVRKRG